MAATPAPLTLEQFLLLTEQKPALEFAEGVVTQKASPQGKQSALQLELATRFQDAGRPGKIARAFTELRTTFACASRVPDVTVYRWDRIPPDARGQVVNAFTTPPDIAIEIVSPQGSVNELVRRCLWYVAHGMQVALLVDPSDESVLAFRADRPPTACRGADHIDVSDVLPHSTSPPASSLQRYVRTRITGHAFARGSASPCSFRRVHLGDRPDSITVQELTVDRLSNIYDIDMREHGDIDYRVAGGHLQADREEWTRPPRTQEAWNRHIEEWIQILQA